MSAVMTDQRFPAKMRLRKRDDFARVYQRRAKAADHVLLVLAAGNGLEHPRIGLSVSRKIGGAVHRNRWKRLLREAFRLSQADLPAGIDLVVIPKPGESPELQRLRRSLVRLARLAADRLADGK